MSRNTSQPLYKHVKKQMLDRIRSGKLGFGALVPCEADLAEEFGCARLTVHRALRELADEGFLERRRRAGTRVAQRASRGFQLSVSRVDEEVFARGEVYRYELITRVAATAPNPVASAFGIAPGAEMLHVVCRHWSNDRVFQTEDRWINTDAIPAAADQPFRHAGPNRWLLDNVPFSEVRHEIAAVAAGPEEARLLKLDAGHPLLQIRRETGWQGRSVTVAVLNHPGELFTLTSQPQAV